MGKIVIKTLAVLLIALSLSCTDIYAYGLEYIIPQNAPKSAMPLHTEWYDITRIVYTSTGGQAYFDGKTYTYTPNDTTAKNECGMRLEGFTIYFENVDSIVKSISTRTCSDSIRLSANEMELLTFFVIVADLPRLMFPHYDRTRTDYKMPVSDVAVYLGRSTYRVPVLGKGQGRVFLQWYDCNKQYITEKMWRQYLEFVFGGYPTGMYFIDGIPNSDSPIQSCIDEATYNIRLEFLQRIIREFDTSGHLKGRAMPSHEISHGHTRH